MVRTLTLVKAQNALFPFFQSKHLSYFFSGEDMEEEDDDDEPMEN